MTTELLVVILVMTLVMAIIFGFVGFLVLPEIGDEDTGPYEMIERSVKEL